VHLGDFPLASKPNNCSWLQNRAGQMLQGLRICPHYQRFRMSNLMLSLRVMLRQTWAGPKAKTQSTLSKRNSPWSNLAKGWGSPTLVHSTSGRKYGWLRFGRRSISPLSRDRNGWNSCKVDSFTGWWWLQIFLETFETSLPVENFHNAEWIRGRWVEMFMKKCASEVWEARKKGRQHNNWQWQICESVWPKMRELTSQSCQIQLSWL